MQANIQTILDELYELEPALRKKEDAIIRIIETMTTDRPTIQIDEVFKAELREKIMIELQDDRITEGQKGRFRASGTTEGQKQWNWGWIVAGFSTTTFAAFAVYTFLGGFAFQDIPMKSSDKMIESTATHRILSFAPSITRLANNAYGNDVSVATNQFQPLGTREAMSSVSPVPMPEDGRGVATDAKMMVSNAMIMPPVDYPYYTYIYTGTLLMSGDLVVYKRNSSGFTSSETASFLSSFALDGIDLSGFENKNLTNLSFVEEKDFGYSVNLDFQNGGVSIFQNWTRWPQTRCDANGCEQLPKLTEKDIPTDEEFIRIADTFLAKYGIERSLYGAPKVDGSWKIMYARAVDTNQEGYIPDQYTITYPVLLDGKNLYEEYGGYKGLMLTIDIRTKRVTGLSGLEKQNLTSSLYTTPTPEDTLRKMIKYGGRYETKPYGEQKTVEISLGEPSFQYVHVYGEWKDGKSDEYYVPAYIFPIRNKPENSYLQDSIILPAVSDFAKFIPMSDLPEMAPLPALMDKAVQ